MNRNLTQITNLLVVSSMCDHLRFYQVHVCLVVYKRKKDGFIEKKNQMDISRDNFQTAFQCCIVKWTCFEIATIHSVH